MLKAGLLVLLLCGSFFSYKVSATAMAMSDNALSLEGYKEVGRAKFSILFFDIYQSRLLTTTGQFSPLNKPYIFEITYLKDITNEDLLERTIEQWQHLSIDNTQYQKYSEQLLMLWPDIKSKDKLALIVEPEKSVFFYNNQFLGAIEDKEFGDLFMAIWLSPNTSQPKLRQQLLGGE